MTNRLQNAAAKARRTKCHVTRLSGWFYESVTPAGHRYTVRCEDSGGRALPNLQLRGGRC